MPLRGGPRSTDRLHGRLGRCCFQGHTDQGKLPTVKLSHPSHAHTVGLAAPTASMVGSGIAAAQGILIKASYGLYRSLIHSLFI